MPERKPAARATTRTPRRATGRQRRATGRPRKRVDAKLIEKLAKIMASRAEIAAIAGCSVSTLDRRFDAAIKRGNDHAKASLRRRQFECAMAGNVTMLIWLGKQWLGQADKVQTESRDLTLEKLIAAAEEDEELERSADVSRGTAQQVIDEP